MRLDGTEEWWVLIGLQAYALAELSQVEKGMIVALFWFVFAKSLLLVLSQAALGRPSKTSSSGLQNAVTSTTSLDLGDPRNLPNTNGGTSGERLSAIESLPESNYATSVLLMCPYRRSICTSGKWENEVASEATTEVHPRAGSQTSNVG